jgi:hypothetical protein
LFRTWIYYPTVLLLQLVTDNLMETDQEGHGGRRRGNQKERMPEKETEPNEDTNFIPAFRRKVPAWRMQIGLS